jgi:hypothetical protein
MMKHAFCLAVALFVLGAGSAHGQQPAVDISFSDGRVTLKAANVGLDEVLEAWARVGGTVVTGVEYLRADRVTIDVVDLSEIAALDELLGSTTSYVSGMRSEVEPGTSLLRALQIVQPRARGDRPVRSTRVIDMSLPESRFEYAAPQVEYEDPTEALDAAPGPPPGPQVMPEMRYQYAEPMAPPVADPDAENVAPTPAPAKPDTKPRPKESKPPSGY